MPPGGLRLSVERADHRIKRIGLRRKIARPLEHSDELVGSVIERLPGGRRFSRQRDLHLRAVGHVHGQLDRVVLDDGRDTHGAEASTHRALGKARAVCLQGGRQHNSIRAMSSAREKVTGQKIAVLEKPRRPGNPPRLIAGSEKVRAELGWKPKFQNVEKIIASAWAWHVKHPHGYGD